MEYRELYKKILGDIDEGSLIKDIEKLWKIELGQTFQNYHKSAKFTTALMEEAGLEKVEKISFPADGRTIYQDKISPTAWDATEGSLTILKSPVAIEDMVVADYKRHPFHLIKGSVSTPGEGMNVRLVTQEQVFHGQDAQGTMVILDPDTRSTGEIIKYLLDAGALGWVNTFLTGRYTTPDGIYWVNAGTEGSHWHVQADDRPFIAFSVSPRTGDMLLSAARKGEVIAKVRCDGRRYKGSVEVTTGIIPGKEKKELWLIGHLYEPLSDDNSTGVVAGIYMAKALKKLFDSRVLPQPRFTLRLVFGLEMYGFAAYAHKRGQNLKNEVIGAINLDAFCCRKGDDVNYWLSPEGSPFFGNYLVEDNLLNIPTDILPDINLTIKREGAYFDDMFISDSTTAIPMIWPLRTSKLHHNSSQTMVVVDPCVLKQYISFHTGFVARILTMSPDDSAVTVSIENSLKLAEAHIREEISKTEVTDIKINWCFEKEKKQIADFIEVASKKKVDEALNHLSSIKKCLVNEYSREDKNLKKSLDDRTGVYWQIAETIIPARNYTGMPYDLALVPKRERKALPEGCIYGPFSRVLANMDGKKNLKYLILHAEWESKQDISDSKVKEYIGAVEYLSEYGYLKNRYTLTIKKKDIVTALKKVGIRTGDLLMVHSGLSAFGHIEGGADTVIDAFLEVIGNKGTLLLPTFTDSFIYFNGESLPGRRCRPYDVKDTSVWVGKIPSVFLKRPGVLRSMHPTHSVAGIGPLAKEILMEHIPSDPPTCRKSPFGKLPEYSGKMVWFGAGLSSTTFFHFLEDEISAPYLKSAVCRMKKKDGRIGTVLIEKHLPGHRDFYRNPGEETKMYRNLLQKGLAINKTTLGFGEIKVIDASAMYRLGMESLKDDPMLLLCDDPGCLFCRRYRVDMQKKKRKLI